MSTGWMLLVALVSLGGLAVTATFATRRLRVRTCPESGKRVLLTVAADDRTGWWTNVERCSARPGSVNCGKACLRSEID